MAIVVINAAELIVVPFRGEAIGNGVGHGAGRGCDGTEGGVVVVRGEGGVQGIYDIGDVLVAVMKVVEGAVGSREMPRKWTSGDDLGWIPDEFLFTLVCKAIEFLYAEIAVVDELAEGVGLGT